MLKNMPHVMFAAVLIAACMFIGFASAAELTVEAPSGSYKAGDVISIPVILNNDIDFAGFYATVNNDMDGVSVSIRQDPSINWAMFESRENPSQHKIIGFVVNPIYDAKVPLFIVDLVIKDESVKNVPLKIVLEEIISDKKGDLPLDTVKKVDLSGIKLTDNVSMSLKTDTGDFLKTPEPTAVKTAKPTTAATTAKPTAAATTAKPTAAATTAKPTAAATTAKPTTAATDNTSGEQTQTPDKTTQPDPTKTVTAKQGTASKAKSPGFAAAVIIGGLAAAYGLLNSRKFR